MIDSCGRAHEWDVHDSFHPSSVGQQLRLP